MNQCRICLSENKPFESIFNKTHDEIYFSLTSIKITEDDKLPHEVCHECSKRLSDILSFKDLCLKSNQILTEKLFSLDDIPVDDYTIVSCIKIEPEQVDTKLTESKPVNSVEESPIEPEPVKKKEKRIPLKCSHPSCTQVFFKQARLESHLRAHAGQKPEKCPICQKELMNYRSFRRHMLIHNNIKKYQCEFCEKTFRSSDNLNVHVNGIHTKEKIYICHICGLKFVHATGLISHQRRHSDEKKYQCNECNRKYKSRTELKDHLIRHRGIRDVICPICQAAFLVKKDLQLHLKHVHIATKKEFKCNECDKQYKKKCQLEAHLRTHTGERPFVCSYCDKRFFQKFTLIKHTYSHTGERPYKCSKCPKAYTESFILKRHMKQQHSE